MRQGLPQQPDAGHVDRGGDPQLRVGAGSAGGATGAGSTRPVTRCMPTGGGFAARAAGGYCGDAVNDSKRPNAHLYATGRLRRVHLRGHGNILKRVLLQACGLNLGLLMRQLMGVGTPRGLQGRTYVLIDALVLALRRFWGLVSRPAALMQGNWAESSSTHPITPFHLHILPGLQEDSSATGC